MKEVSFFVPGIPKGQPRPRAFKMGNRVRVYDPGTAENWKSCIAMAVQDQLPEIPFSGPVTYSIQFYLQRPKNLFRKKDPEGIIPHTKKPDIDNLLKSVFDAFTHLGLWHDDTQLYKGTAEKNYHSKTGKPGAMMKFFFMEVPDDN